MSKELSAPEDAETRRMIHLLAAVGIFEEGGLVVEISERELSKLHREMEAAVAATEKVIASMRALTGPVPGPVPQHLLTLLQMGNGYSRTARDTLRRLFRARNVRRAKGRKGAKP